jgi:hypothetical protein
VCYEFASEFYRRINRQDVSASLLHVASPDPAVSAGRFLSGLQGEQCSGVIQKRAQTARVSIDETKSSKTEAVFVARKHR